MKGELSSINKKGERVICDTATSLIIDVAGKAGRVSDDLKKSGLGISSSGAAAASSGDGSGVKRHEGGIYVPNQILFILQYILDLQSLLFLLLGLAVMKRMGEGDAGDLGNGDPHKTARFMQRTLGALGSLQVHKHPHHNLISGALSDRLLVLSATLMLCSGVLQVHKHPHHNLISGGAI